MGANGWRRLVIASKAHISIQGNAVSIRQDSSINLVPISQLCSIMIENPFVTLSSAFLTRIAKENIALVFCDGKYMPAAEFVSLYNDTSNRLENQIQWRKEQKSSVWMQILHQKLQSEIELLEKYSLPNSQQICYLQSCIRSSDQCDTIESQAARYYFNSLYGKGFCRRTENPINSALNYGYSIILSAISRAITIHGLHPAIGIHHANQRNPFNLSCDLIEPFRAAVDECVYCTPDRELDWSYKKELINITRKHVSYDNKHMELEQAIDCLVLDVIAAMKCPENKIGVLCYA